MLYTTTLVANNILNRAFAEKHELCKDKLQIILYFVASEYHKETGMPLFSECFEACARVSPSLQSVNHAFRSYCNKPITRFARNASGETRMINEDAEPVLRRVLNRVWQATKDRDVVFFVYSGTARRFSLVEGFQE